MANHVLQFELARCSFRLSQTRLCWYKLGPRTNTLAFDTLFMQHTKGLRFFLSFLLYFRTCKGFEDILNTYPPLWFYCCIDVQQIHVPMCSQSKVKLKILQIIVQFLNVEILLNTVRTRLMKSVTDRWYLYWNWLCQITKPSK